MALLSKAFWISATLIAAMIEGDRAGDVRVVPVENTPEPDAVEMRIAYPREGEVDTDNPIMVQLRLESYALGVYSDFPRAKEIQDTKEGQAVHIIIDGRPFVAVNEAIDEMSETEEIDYDQTINMRLPYKLPEGEHIMRVFPVRSFGESLKGPGVFQAAKFYVGKKTPALNVDLSIPYLTYNQPQGEFDSKKPILLDFCLANTQLSPDGYKVRLTIDGSDKRLLSTWSPYYIYGLKKGSHTLKLELLDPSGSVIKPLFDDLQKTIIVK